MPGRRRSTITLKRDFYKISEVADRWGLTYDTVWRMVRQEKIPSATWPGFTMLLIPAVFVDSVPGNIVAQWLEQQRGGGPEQPS